MPESQRVCVCAPAKLDCASLDLLLRVIQNFLVYGWSPSAGSISSSAEHSQNFSPHSGNSSPKQKMQLELKQKEVIRIIPLIIMADPRTHMLFIMMCPHPRYNYCMQIGFVSWMNCCGFVIR